MTYMLPTRLTVEDVAAIAGGAAVDVSAVAREQVAAYHRSADDIAGRQPIYGRSTGVGANRLSPAESDPVAHGMSLLRSHAVDAGPAIARGTVRAMLAVRLNQLLHPGSGIDVSLVDGLARMLDADAMPEIRRFGGIGTADLPALAGTALALAGERPVDRDGFDPIGSIRSDSALPFMSSSALTLAGAALVVARLQTLIRAELAAFALSAVALRANPSAFSAEAALAVAIPTANEQAARLTGLLGSPDWSPARIQDPFAFRGFLPAISMLDCATRRLREVVETLTSRAQENPRFFAEEGHAVHHGAFLETWLAHELDATAIALAQNAPLALARLRFANDDSFSGLPRFLSPGGRGSGTMVVEYLVASAMGDIHAASAPVSVQSAVLSCGVEEDATFAPTALDQLERAVTAFETMVASEVLVAVRAHRLRESGTEAAPSRVARLVAIARRLPEEMADRDLRGDVELARELIPVFAATVDDALVTRLP